MPARRKREFVRLHAIQALALWVVAVVGSVAVTIIGIPLLFVPIIGWVIGLLLRLVMWIGIVVLGIMGVVNGGQGAYWEMPVVHGLIRSYI